MVDTVPRPAYREQLHALLPTGPAWSPDSGTVLDELLDAIASQMADVDQSGANLLDEIRPSTTFELLPDWERVVGLPDICSVLGSTVTVRRASLLEKLVSKPTLHPSEFVRIGETFGVTITVEEHDQTRADADSSSALEHGGGDGAMSGGSRFRPRRTWCASTCCRDFDTPFRSVGAQHRDGMPVAERRAGAYRSLHRIQCRSSHSSGSCSSSFPR